MTNTGDTHGFERTLGWIKEADAELKIVIAGNHDLSLDTNWYYRYGRYYHTNPEDPSQLFASLPSNIHYLDEESRTFTLSSGATFKVYGSPWTPEFGFWAFNYPHDIDRWNPDTTRRRNKTAVDRDPIPEDTDILITHGPPQGLHDSVYSGRQNVGCPHLRRAIERIRPRLHVFGHIHEGHGVTRVTWKEGGGGEEKRMTVPVLGAKDMVALAKSSGACPALEVDVSKSGEVLAENETLVVNASIMAETMMAIHAGVLVDMEFPVVQSGEGPLNA
ncbi:Metallo-dependent phosphatase-like protein [Tuber brumale]|nr:Metallo-dependent phosphatase-like protein [Tuber brumale]